MTKTYQELIRELEGIIGEEGTKKEMVKLRMFAEQNFEEEDREKYLIIALKNSIDFYKEMRSTQ